MTISALGKILVVDDEVELKNILVQALTSQGYEASGFTSGEAALEALRSQAFDVLLTDLMMPGMDGIALVRAGIEIDPNLVCIMMTGQGTIQTAVDAMKVGAFDYVVKPFRLQTMLPVLTRAMNTRHLRLENVQLREAVAIHELSETIAFTLDPQTVLSKLADGALQQSEADEVSILLPTSDGAELYVAAVRGEKRERLLGERVPLQQSISSWVARERTPLILNGEVQDERFVALWPRAEIRSAISVPMQVANKLVGIINLNMTNRLRPFTLGQMKALTILAGTAAAALESASLYTKVQEAEKNYRSIFENAIEGIFQSTSDRRFLTVNPALARILGYDSPEEVVRTFTDFTQQLYVHPELVAAVTQDLEGNGVVQGFEFEAYRKDREKIWLSLNIRLVRDQTGAAIYREGTIEDITERKRAETERLLMFEIIRGAITTPNLDELLKLVHTSISKLVDAENCFVALHDPATNLVHYQFWTDKFDPAPASRQLGTGFSSHVIRSGQPLLLTTELRSEIEARGEVIVRGRPARSWLGVPLQTSAGTIGALVLQHYETEGAYTQRDLELLSSVGRQIGLVIERKRAEAEQTRLNAEIKEKTDRLNTLVATVPGVVFEVTGLPGSVDQKTNFVSEYVTPMLGYSVSEWLATPQFWLSIAHPDDRERVQRDASTEFVQGRDGAHEFRWIRKDRQIVWVRAHTIIVRGEDGNPIGVRGVVTDITERKRGEEMQARRETHALFRADVSAALAVGRAPLRATLESCTEAMVKHLSAAFARIWTLDRDGKILELQASAGIYTHIDGGHARVPVGQFKIGEIAQERAPHITNEVQNDPRVSDKEWAREQGMVAFAGYPLMVEDRLLGVMAMFARDPLPDDTLDALQSVADVISQGIERRRAERDLRESEERYRDLVENAHDIIYSHDLEGNYTSMNEAGAQITGYTVAEALALNQTQTVAPEFKNKVHEMIARKLAGVTDTAFEMEIVAKDGHRIMVEANTKLVYHDGVPVGVQGIARDVTERKHLEEQLRQSQKMEAIGQLAGGVAHDFNNLLTAINGYSGLALQRIDEHHPLRSYLEEIKKAGDRAANLTRQLLAFGRKQILQPLPINLNDIVSDMNKMLHRLIGEDIVLTARLDPALNRVKADPGQIEQVLVNLVVNARDAMPQGGNLTIETATVELDQEYANTRVGVLPGHYVMLAVSDTGIGMDEATEARIFLPFFTTKEKGKGTGLGLSTVYGIVKQSGGNILVYSEPGHGTTFKVYLPQIKAEPQKVDAAVVELAMPSGSETILLVEDEDVVRGLASKILEQAGYKVLAASRGAEAIRLCRERNEPIHLLLTDVVMPETSGKEVADQVTELLPSLRVLFMSGYTDEAIVHHGVLDSNVEFIQKPFTPAGLVMRVREVLDSELVMSD